MSWIMKVVRSATWGRAVKTPLFLTPSSSWFSSFSKEPQRLKEAEEKEDKEERGQELAGRTFLSIGCKKKENNGQASSNNDDENTSQSFTHPEATEAVKCRVKCAAVATEELLNGFLLLG